MKKLILSISLILTFFIGFGQPIVQRSTGTNTLVDPNLFTSKSFRLPVFLDTTAANAITSLDSAGKLIFTYTGNSVWVRESNPKKWVQIGGTVQTQNSNSILLSGDGSPPSPLIASVIPSGQTGNILQVLSDGVFVPNFIQNGRISGGFITWVANYTYDVTSVNYAINGVPYFAPETQVTLANSDPTFNRIDRIVANSNSTISVITGTPSSDPQEPSYDPTTQVPLGFILVTAASTAPTINQEWIYINNTEWTTSSSSARIVANSTSNPYSPLLDVEGTLARNADFMRFTDPTPPTTMSAFNILTLKIRSKGVFDATSRIELRWENNLVAVGNPIGISDGTYGFISGQTSTYQTISIPLSQFGALTTVTSLIMIVRTSNGNTIGFYIDDIQLQQAIVPVSGNAWVQGGNFMASTGVLGTLDNFPINYITNNVVRMSMSTTSNTDFKGLDGVTSIVNINPNNGGTMRIGSTTATTPALIINHQSGGGRYGSLFFQDNSVDQGYLQQITASTLHYNFNTHVFRSSNAATEYGRFNSSGEFLINETDAGDFKLQVEGGVRLDATGKAIALVGLSTDNTATQVLSKDGSGNSVWRDVSTITGSAITANNGVNMSTATNVQLGGALTVGTTTIDLNSRNLNFTLATGGDFNVASNDVTLNIDEIVSISGTSTTSLVNITNTSATTSSKALTITAGNGIAFEASSAGPSVTANIEISPIADGSFEYPILQLTRSAGVASVNGLAGSLDFFIQTSTSEALSNQVVSKLTDVTHATRTSQFIVRGVLSAVTNDILTIDGDGTVTLGAEYQGLGAGYIAVSNTGVLSWASATGSMTNPLTAQGGIIYSADGAGTPAELLIGTTGQYLAVSAGGIPEWVTPGVGGSVTSVGLTSSDITVGGTASPITTSGTFTLTLATVNGNVGSFGSSTSIPTFTVNAKGLITAASGNAVIAPAGTLTGATLAAGVTVSSLTSVGALVSGTASTGFVVGGVTMTLGSDAAWDMYVRNASGVLIRIPNGTTGQVLVATTGAIPGWTNAGAGTVTNVTGTANRITSTGGATPQIDISGSYAGQNTITILGTIATGVWNGTAIGTNKGGTGFTSMTNGTIPIGNGGGTWTQATPTGSNGISITMGAGTMNVSNVFNPTVQTLTFGSPIVWNVTNGGNAKVTLTGTGATLSIANPVAGYTYTVEITQGSGGSKTITTWPTGTTWSGPNTLSATAGDTDLAVLYYNGTNYRAVLTLDYN